MKQAEFFRDQALKRVGLNSGDFMLTALTALQELHGKSMTGEQIRVELESRGVVPHHHNAWGALVRQALKTGLLHPTGNWVKMSTAKSHARRTPEYWVGWFQKEKSYGLKPIKVKK